MIEAKTHQSKAFWAALIVVSVSMTCISICRTVDNFLAETSHIVAEHMEIDEMLYPPLKVCLTHWLFWTNWTAAESMNFSKQEVLYAMNHLQSVFSEKPFDVDEVEESFFQKLKANNMSFIEQFYVKIALKRKDVLKSLRGEKPEYETVIENYQVDPSWPPYYILCYKFSEDEMTKKIQKVFSKRLTKGSPVDKIAFVLFSGNLAATSSELSWLTKDEYDKTFDSKVMHQLWNIYNGYDKNGEFIYNGYSKFAKINAVVRHWKNHFETPCHDDRKWIEGNMTCFEKCGEEFLIEKTNNLSKWNFTQKIFTFWKGIYFLDPINRTDWKKYEKMPSKLISVEKVSAEEKAQMRISYNKCIESCKQDVGCNLWSFSVSSVEMPRFDTRNVMIVYPTKVEVMKEVHVQTWEHFVSSVGGLLGIWSGASILTILQFIYLLFSQNRVHPQC